MPIGGSPSDWLFDERLKGAIEKMEKFGYSKEALRNFSAYELDWMYKRLEELQWQQRIDGLIKKLDDWSKNKEV